MFRCTLGNFNLLCSGMQIDIFVSAAAVQNELGGNMNIIPSFAGGTRKRVGVSNE